MLAGKLFQRFGGSILEGSAPKCVYYALIKRERKSSQVTLCWLVMTPVKRRHKSSQVLYFR